MLVFVLNKHGKPLMPCKPRKARILLKEKKAKIVSYEPFTNDKVRVFGKVGFISGFTSGGAYIKDILGNYITIPEKTYKQVSFKYLEFIGHNNNWQFIPHLRIA